MEPADPGLIPSGGSADWLARYREQAAAKIAHAEAALIRRRVVARLVLAHVDLPGDLRRARVEVDPSVVEAIDVEQAAAARYELAQAEIRTAERVLEERGIAARELEGDVRVLLDAHARDMGELRAYATDVYGDLQRAARTLLEAAARPADR